LVAATKKAAEAAKEAAGTERFTKKLQKKEAYVSGLAIKKYKSAVSSHNGAKSLEAALKKKKAAKTAKAREVASKSKAKAAKKVKATKKIADEAYAASSKAKEVATKAHEGNRKAQVKAATMAAAARAKAKEATAIKTNTKKGKRAARVKKLMKKMLGKAASALTKTSTLEKKLVKVEKGKKPCKGKKKA